MTLTEEQRAALKRVAAYMDEMYSVASPYHGCTEDSDLLRAMIDSSEHFTDASKMPGFDLEKARAGISHYRIENPSNVDTECALKELVDQANLAEDAIAEIERLRARITELEGALVEERAGAIRCESYDHCEGMYRIDLPDAMIRAQQELQADGKIGPDATKPRSWQITDKRLDRRIKPFEKLPAGRTPGKARGPMTTAKDAFSLSARDWAKLERKYAEVMVLPADKLVARLLEGASKEQQKYLALGIMVGRMSK